MDAPPIDLRDPALAGACGAYCGACLALRGELSDEAGRLLVRLRRQGFLALARRLDPADAPRIDAALEVLERLARTPACPGCGRGGGLPGCPVRGCARGRALATCAGCGRLADCAAGEEEPGGGRARAAARRREREALRASDGRAFPFGPAACLLRLTRKYGGWNLANLEAIRARGLEAWLAQRAACPNFRSLDLKGEEDVWGDD
jgi:hypothetical protein